MMSACLVTAQKPSSSKPAEPWRWAFHQTGEVRRSSANSCVGTRLAYRSGSVKSNPGGISGSATAASGVIGNGTRSTHLKPDRRVILVGTAVIVEAVRTPIGRRGGGLSGLHAAEILGVA